MIISSAPFRISFAGGGSDIPVYYRAKKGAVLSTSINKYIYISLHPYFDQGETLLKYSKNELVRDPKEIVHPIFREAITEICPQGGVEIVSTADIPSGTGLGSSSSFTVALLNVLYAYNGKFCSKDKLAAKACEIEIERLGEPIGKQDQYAAAHGGLNLIEFNPNETVLVTPVILPKHVVTALESNLLLFYTGDQRNTREILTDQCSQVSTNKDKQSNLSKMVDLAYRMRDQLLNGDLECFANSMHEGWVLKRTLSSRITNSRIEKFYERAREYGAIGGKLLGAGGGGFLLLYCNQQKQNHLRKALFDCFEMPFRFDWGGTRIIYVGDRWDQAGFINGTKG
ncbi:MAG: GHMP kinase [Syntrophobacteraceae bacterium]